METSDDFGRPVAFQAPGLSSTSGEGEAEAGKGAYSFTARRKNRRKTITHNDIQRLTTGTQSLSESAFGTPSPSPFNAALPPSQLRLQTSFNQLDYTTPIPSSPPGQPSPRRTSGRNTVNSSPIRKQTGFMPGVTAGNSDTIAADVLKELERGRGRGIPRTLTLPAHLTESLLKMTITRERESSADHIGFHPETGVLKRMGNTEKDGMDVDWMEVDAAAEPRKPTLRIIVENQKTEEATLHLSQANPPPRSTRKSKRRRARSLPPRRSNPHEDPCEGDDEETEREDDNSEPLSPAPPHRRRGRPGAGLGTMGVNDAPMEITMPGMVPITSSVLRRSARRVNPVAGGGMGMPFGGTSPFLRDIAEAEAGSGMEIAEVVISKERISRKCARTREAEGGGSGMEAVDIAGKAGGNAPRKRARTREGGDRERERGRDEEGRATKRTRKR